MPDLIPTPGDRPASTVFEPIDGGPADGTSQPNIAEDFTVPRPEGLDDTPFDDLPDAPGQATQPQAEPPSEDVDQSRPATVPREPKMPGRKRTASERIRELIGQRNEARDEANATAEQLALMREQIAQSHQMIAALAQQRTAPVQQPSQSPAFMSQEDFNPGTPAPAQGQPPDVQAAIRAALQQELGPLLQEARQRTAAEAAQRQLLAEHNASFERAAEDYPELRDLNSVFRKQFNELYANSPLSQLPNAPEQLALQVRGLLADERAGQRQVATRKRGAAVMSPQSTAVDELAGEDVNSLRQALDPLLRKLRQGDASLETYTKVRMLRQAINQKGKS